MLWSGRHPLWGNVLIRVCGHTPCLEPPSPAPSPRISRLKTAYGLPTEQLRVCSYTYKKLLCD